MSNQPTPNAKPKLTVKDLSNLLTMVKSDKRGKASATLELDHGYCSLMWGIIGIVNVCRSALEYQEANKTVLHTALDVSNALEVVSNLLPLEEMEILEEIRKQNISSIK